MKSALLPARCIFLCGLVISLTAFPDEIAKKTAPENAKQNEAAAAKVDATATSNSTTASRGPVIDGEHFTVRQLIDKQQNNLPVGVFIAPEKWKDQSHVIWNYADSSSPVKIDLTIENPTNEEAFYAYPAAEFFCLRPDYGYYRQGQNSGGMVYTMQPLQPASTILALAQRARPNVSNLKIIGYKDLPDLVTALNLPKSENQKGIGLKITYDMNGKSISEEFYAVYFLIQIPYDGPQGRTYQINWGLLSPHSFRAPAEAMNRRRPVFAAIAKSFRPNPAWKERQGAINAYLRDQFNRQLQAGYNQIAAAAALSKQISANNDAMVASIDRSLQASRAASASSSAARTSSDKFDDYIRGVETLDDPYYGTSQHSFNDTYHWTDGYGNYRHSNDGTYNPNQHENGDWQLMPATR